MSKCEMVKKYKSMVTFQAQCFNEQKWDEYDRVEDAIKKLEKDILGGNCED